MGLRPENIEKALPRLRVGPPSREPISLRYAPAESLAAHPYISWRLARQLIRQRQSWGDRPIPPRNMAELATRLRALPPYAIPNWRVNLPPCS